MTQANDNTPSDSDLLDFLIEEHDGDKWMDTFPLFRPMIIFPDGSWEYTEKYIDKRTFKQHLIGAFNRWKSPKG